ncbi:MAG TPA: tetratricopeptide repeat protein [Candidatus Dormibacteraeota bacterium]|nr:tetratricopeptide repeat protein [Candidatus Dormibacteraeota bacterium]
MSRKRQSRKLEATAARDAAGPVARALNQRWVSWLVPVLIALLTLAVFLPTLQNQFAVYWDDDKNLLDNYHYRGLGSSQLRWMFTAFHMGHYIPLTWMTFGLDYLLWGMKPVGYHLTSLLLHATNAVVFYFVARRLLALALPGPVERCPAALALSAASAALLFALHPLRVESVAWATERRDVLSGLFYLLTILAYLRACQPGARDRGWYWGSVALFACALLSKSMAVSLPVVLLVLDLYPLRRLGGARGWWGESARGVYVEKIPFVLLAGATSALAFLALLRLHNMAPLEDLGVPGRLAISAYGVSFYLWKTLVPFNLSPLYELRAEVNLWATPFILSYGVVLALTALALALRRRLPGLPAVWLAYVVILLPVLGIFQNGLQIAADRYTYLAGLGWAILAGAGLLYFWQKRTPLMTGFVVCILLGLGALTWNQVQVWHDSEKLWTHALAIDPKTSIARSKLGAVLADQGKLSEATDHFRQALDIQPDYADPHNGWGLALAQQGKLAEAIDHYQQALRIKPDLAEAHDNWGLALARQGKFAEAIDQYQQALHIRPDLAEAHHNWGVALLYQGKPAQAIDHFQQAVHIKPDFAEAHNNWGVALGQQGKLAEAIDQYQQALRIRPNSANVYNNWGTAVAQQGKLAEAIGYFQQALRIRPDFAEAHKNWGLILAQQGRLEEAAEHFAAALQIEPGHAQTESNLLRVLQGRGTAMPLSRKGLQ